MSINYKYFQQMLCILSIRMHSEHKFPLGRWQLHKRLSHVELRQRVNSDRSSEINRIMKEERVMPTRKQEKVIGETD